MKTGQLSRAVVTPGDKDYYFRSISVVSAKGEKIQHQTFAALCLNRNMHTAFRCHCGHGSLFIRAT